MNTNLTVFLTQKEPLRRIYLTICCEKLLLRLQSRDLKAYRYTQGFGGLVFEIAQVLVALCSKLFKVLVALLLFVNPTKGSRLKLKVAFLKFDKKSDKNLLIEFIVASYGTQEVF